jgi:predicted permease
LIALGLLLRGQPFHFERDVGADTVLKLAIAPVFKLGVASVFTKGGDERLALLIAVTATASGMAMIAAHCRANESKAAATVFLTTLLSLIACPVVTTLV